MNMQKIIKQDTLSCIEDLKQSSFLPIVCEPIEHCIFAYVSGSRLSGLADDMSDIDIVVILDSENAVYKYTGRYLKYWINDEKYLTVQWFPKSIEQVFTTSNRWNDSKKLQIAGLPLFRNLTEEYIIYKNPKYQHIIDNFLKYKEQIANFGVYKLYNVHQNIICQFLATKQLTNFRIFTQLCYATEVLKQFPIKEQILTTIRNIKYNHNPDLDYIYEQLLFLSIYIHDNPLDLQTEANRLIQCIYNY